jgi:hypothetical protein
MPPGLGLRSEICHGRGEIHHLTAARRAGFDSQSRREPCGPASRLRPLPQHRDSETAMRTQRAEQPSLQFPGVKSRAPNTVHQSLQGYASFEMAVHATSGSLRADFVSHARVSAVSATPAHRPLCPFPASPDRQTAPLPFRRSIVRHDNHQIVIAVRTNLTARQRRDGVAVRPTRGRPPTAPRRSA